MMMKRRYLYIKRLVDLCCSIVGLVLFSPLFLVLSIWIKLDSSGPVFFRQKRIGKGGHVFLIYKFRTMIVDAEKQGKQITVGDDRRITRCGTILRKYKLDELPQLINVIRGEMSLVGPRPEVPAYVQLYDDQQRRVFTVSPGLTDEASIKYRHENQLLQVAEDAERTYIEVIMPDKLRINLRYLETASIRKDLGIIFKTLFAVVKR
ncbi:UNVERIFIED_CONTAM: lipopolysaccharide/colanic/teichoic acid biosynthesis glycosyltransferase [Brevibacillus sp. OAP136]